MRYLISLLLLLLCADSYAAPKNNPFNVMLNIRNNDAEGDQTQHLVAKVRSVSSEQDRASFLLRVKIPGTNIEIIEGKDYYKGALKGLEEKEFFVVLKGTKEGEGEITVKVFPIIDDKKIDNENMRLFTAKYKVSPELIVSLGDLIEKDTATVTKQEIRTEEDLKNDTGAEKEKTEKAEATPEVEENNAQQFVIEGTFRHNTFYRSIMVLVSILILVYLYIRIKKPL